MRGQEKPLPAGTQSPADAGAVTQSPQWAEKARENQDAAKK